MINHQGSGNGTPMRALFVCPNLAAGGAERVWSILLPGLRERGIDARLVALDGGGPFVVTLVQKRVPVEVLNMRHRTDLGPLVRSQMLRGFAPEVVVSRCLSGLYVGWAVARWRRSPLIFNDHLQVGLDLSSRQEAMVRLTRRWLDRVVVVAGGQCEAWINRGYRRDRVVIVRNGVEIPNVTESRVAIRRELDIPDSSVAAVFVASLRPEKRVRDFVAAVRRVREKHPKLIGLVVGDGPDRSALTGAAAGASAIRVLGYRDDVSRILKAADVFVLSSDYEAAPMAILEAMASGLPIVATDVGAVREMVGDSETGLLVPPRTPAALAASLARLVDNAQMRRAMGQAGMQRHRERWDADLMIAGYARVLEHTVRN